MTQNGLSHARPIVSLCVVLLTCWVSSAYAGQLLNATPDNIDAVIKNAAGGDRIILGRGVYNVLTLKSRSYSPELEIIANDAQFSGIVVYNSTGITLRGAAVFGPGEKSYGILIRSSKFIRIEDFKISGAYRGIVVHTSSNISLLRNKLTSLISDGIDIAESGHVEVVDNDCNSFHPIGAIFDESGRRLKDGDHPDCIQAWSRPSSPPTNNLVIVNNRIDGAMQGIFLGNHIRNGVDDGGFDNVIIKHNHIRVSSPHGITANSVRGGEITNNIIETIPGAVMNKPPFHKIRAALRFDGVNLRVCANVVAQLAKGPGTAPCQ